MELLTTIFLLTACFSAVPGQLTFPPNATANYQLKTCLKPNQPGKERFDNLWLFSYHTGAGLGDATLSATGRNQSAVGYLSPTNQTSSTGQEYYDQIMNLGNAFPWSMSEPATDTLMSTSR